MVKKFDTFADQAYFQEMSVHRVKAIAILEFLQGVKIKDGDEWFILEDELTRIIESE